MFLLKNDLLLKAKHRGRGIYDRNLGDREFEPVGIYGPAEDAYTLFFCESGFDIGAATVLAVESNASAAARSAHFWCDSSIG